MSPHILEYGEWLGNIEIIRVVIVLRSATLYEAQIHKRKVLLKVAHPGIAHTDRLKREVKLLQELDKSKVPDNSFPKLIPPYADNAKEGYGKAILKGNLLYYFLFEHFEGEPLRDSLIKTPQLWIYHIGWVVINLARSVAFLHSKGMLHCGLSPEVILVHFEGDPSVPNILLFDLGIVSRPETVYEYWYKDAVLPAYTAPELLTKTFADYRTDVYGLGLILYELLVGKPVFPFRLSNDTEIYEAIRTNRRTRMDRSADVEHAAELAVQFTKPEPVQRPADMTVALNLLLKNAFVDAPAAKHTHWFNSRNVLLLLGILLFSAFLFTVLINFVVPGN
jgi:serine/threonine protein kinase